MLFIQISESTRAGLARMVDAMLGKKHQFIVCKGVDLALATLLIYLAKMADDSELFFPCGKWATIQAMEDKVEQAILGVKK